MEPLNDSQVKCSLTNNSSELAGIEQAIEWGEPEPLIQQDEPFPYPIDALPDVVRDAVLEVQAFAKCPLPMAATCALAAISVAGQSLLNVKRAEKLTGPCSLWFLTIAESGERKTTVDGFFTKAIREYQGLRYETNKILLADYQADLTSWQTIRDGIQAKLKKAIQTNGDKNALMDEAKNHEARKPEKPRIPNFIRGDDSPEKLADALANDWPSAGVISSEAATIFGGQAMGRDSVSRNLGLLNVLWDGGEHLSGRIGRGDTVLKNARITMSLQVQESALNDFFVKTGALARGTGFLARFLLCKPDSTQGERMFTESPDHWPCLDAFNQRMTDVLNLPVHLDKEGGLSVGLVDLSPEAKKSWIEFHDGIEAELSRRGDFASIRDVAAKAADNAVRLAGLFQLFRDGSPTMIDAETMQSAAGVVLWHLGEAKRFFEGMEFSPENEPAYKLDKWLADYCNDNRTNSIPCSYALQHGPNILRKADDLHAATESALSLSIKPKSFASIRQSWEVENEHKSVERKILQAYRHETTISRISRISISRRCNPKL